LTYLCVNIVFKVRSVEGSIYLKEILKPLFDWYVGNFNFSDNLIANSIVTSVIGLFAFVLAYRFVGWIYQNGFIESRNGGSIIHWIVRVIIFVILYYVAKFTAFVGNFILSIPYWGWVSVLILCVAYAMIYFLKRLIQKHQVRHS